MKKKAFFSFVIISMVLLFLTNPLPAAQKKGGLLFVSGGWRDVSCHCFRNLRSDHGADA